MKPKRSEPPVRIRLKGLSATQVLHPGDRVSGVVEIQPDVPVTCRGIEIKFGWHTEGKGDRDQQVHDLIKLPETALSPDAPLVEPFDFTMPDQPWSYRGHFINIVWSIDVKVDIAWARDLTGSQTLILQPLEPA